MELWLLRVEIKDQYFKLQQVMSPHACQAKVSFKSTLVHSQNSFLLSLRLIPKITSPKIRKHRERSLHRRGTYPDSQSLYSFQAVRSASGAGGPTRPTAESRQERRGGTTVAKSDLS